MNISQKVRPEISMPEAMSDNRYDVARRNTKMEFINKVTQALAELESENKRGEVARNVQD